MSEERQIRFSEAEKTAMEKFGWTKEDILKIREHKLKSEVEKLRKTKETIDDEEDGIWSGKEENKKEHFLEAEEAAMEKFGWTKEDILKMRAHRIDAQVEKLRREKEDMDAVTKEVAKAAGGKLAKAVAKTGIIAVISIFTVNLANSARKEAVDASGQLIKIAKNVIKRV